MQTRDYPDFQWPSEYRQVAKSHFAYGNELLAQGSYAKAINEYTTALYNREAPESLCRLNIHYAKRCLSRTTLQARGQFAAFLQAKGADHRISVETRSVCINTHCPEIRRKIRYKRYSLENPHALIPNRSAPSNLVLICDRAFAEATIISAHSCISNAGHIANLYILAVDCFPEIACSIKHLSLGGSRLHILDLPPVFTSLDAYKGLVTPTALYKCLLPYLLPSLDSVLYIDSDVLVLDTLQTLFQLPLDNIYAHVVEDYVGTTIHKEHLRLGASKYFNSGVMHLNLALMRETHSPETLLDLKFTRNNIKYMDQDLFNIHFGDNVHYLSPSYNYMTTNERLPHGFFKQACPDFDTKHIKLLHYSYKKPWQTLEVSAAHLWHQEYYRAYNRHHDLRADTKTAQTDLWADAFLHSTVRHKSVLVVEAADCHGEIAPGLVHTLRQMNYYVDVVFTNGNLAMNSLARLQADDPTIRVYNNDKYSIYKLLSTEKLKSYEFIVFTTRSLYYKLGDKLNPTIFEYFSHLESLKHKIISIEHHLEYLSESFDESENIIVLANPANAAPLSARVVNIPFFGKTNVRLKNKRCTFIAVGSIESERKNHELLIRTLSELRDYGYDYTLRIVARRGDLRIPDLVAQHVELYTNVSYSHLYTLLEESDYLLPLLDPDVEAHRRYLTCGTSGTFQLSYGFLKPCIIHSDFARPYGFDHSNSFVYYNNEDLTNTMIDAINLDQGAYTALQTSLGHFVEQLVSKSKENFYGVLDKLTQRVSASAEHLIQSPETRRC